MVAVTPWTEGSEWHTDAHQTPWIVPDAVPAKLLFESPEPLGPQAVGMPVSTPEIDSVADEAANAVVGSKAIEARPATIASRCVRNLSISASSDRSWRESQAVYA